jgi:DMSO/TMAO reductase YedYZ heme-binding membrane subunit
MKVRNIILVIAGILVAVFYVLIADAVKYSEPIWILTRAYGLFAYLFLFLLVVLGEFKLLGFKRLFRFHCTAGIITAYLVLLHFISAVFDKFKWGKNLVFSDFLGFNFSDKYLTFVSIGTLAFYLILLISVTSSRMSMSKLGFKRWKLVHYLSYVVLAAVFVHSMALGTDLKTSALRAYIFPFVVFSFSFAAGILLLRSFKGALSQRKWMVLFILLILLISAGVAYSANLLRMNAEKTASLKLEKDRLVYDLAVIQAKNADLNRMVYYLESQINLSVNRSERISRLIDEIRLNITRENVTENITQPPPVIPPDDEWEDDEEEEEEEDDD